MLASRAPLQSPRFVKLVSVILPLYKSEAFIAATLGSVLAQTYRHLELVVVDDGSPDNSAQICRDIGDERIRIFSRPNTGACRSRNFGIGQARGDFIAFIDHDDLWLPTKLEKHVEHLARSPKVGVSYGPSEFMDQNGHPLGLYQTPKLTGIDARTVLCRNPIGNGSAPLIRREVFEETKFTVERDGRPEVMYFDDQSIGWEDVELWFRMIYTTQWEFEGIPECLTLYRLVPGGISGVAKRKQKAMEQGLARARRYADSFLQEHEAAAIAYHLRYLARRLVQSHDRRGAVSFIHRALRTYPGLITEDPLRTLATLVAAYAQFALPPALFGRVERIGRGLLGRSQSRWLKG
jgi:glycosyltransferase involved in cell wall biosynthesis